MSARSYFFGFVDDEFNNAANWSRGLLFTGNNGFLMRDAEMSGNYNTATGIGYHLYLNAELRTGSFELQHRSGNNGTDLHIANGFGTVGRLIVEEGGRLDVAGTGADVFVGTNYGEGHLVFESGSTFQISKTLEVHHGSVTMGSGAIADGNFQDELVIDKATLAFEISKNDEGGFDNFTFTGQSLQVELGLGSTLELTFDSPPELGTTFDLITGVSGFVGVTGRSGDGTFGQVVANGLAEGTAVEVVYGANALQATIVAETAPANDLIAPLFVRELLQAETQSYTVTVANGGTSSAIAISDLQITGGDAADVSNLSYPDSIPVGGSADITFDFTPSVASARHHFALEIYGEGEVLLDAVPVELQLLGAVGTTNTDLINFGEVVPGSGIQTYTLTVTNNGENDALEFPADEEGVSDSVILQNRSGFSFGEMPEAIAPGESAEIEVYFDAGTETGDFIGALELNTTAYPSAVVRVGLQATVANYSPQLEATEAVTLAQNSASQTFSIIVENAAGDETTPLALSGVTVSGADAGLVSNLVFPTTIAAGVREVVNFDFTPTRSGAHTFEMEIASNDLSQPSPRVVSITINVAGPQLSSVGSFDFGAIAYSDDARVIGSVPVTNNGAVGNLVFDETNSYAFDENDFEIVSFPEPLAPGASGVVEVAFFPFYSGFYEDDLILTLDGEEGSLTIPMTGFMMASGNSVGFDFGTADSPVAEGYRPFVVSEGATTNGSGISLAIQSRDGDLVAGTDAEGGDDLSIDGAETTYNGSAGNYISVLISGQQTGELAFYSHFNMSGTSFGVPLEVTFGEVGSEEAPIYVGPVLRTGKLGDVFDVESGKTYELRITENANLNSAYISSLLLSGSAVPDDVPSAYLAFASAAGLDPATTGAIEEDADGDSLPNGLEWVVGGAVADTESSDLDKLPTALMTSADPDGDEEMGDYFVYRFPRSSAAGGDARTSIAVQYGSDLSGWDTAVDGNAGVVVVETVDGVESGVDLVEYYLPASLAVEGSLFVRLSVQVF
ncbi:choice-of-anchor D domain-containing protein [Roseibacillus ishigakijimensis]|nr:choice-of-anchor D domain-containing protein [Roseibacillus ishigakijimensis]